MTNEQDVANTPQYVVILHLDDEKEIVLLHDKYSKCPTIDAALYKANLNNILKISENAEWKLDKPYFLRGDNPNESERFVRVLDARLMSKEPQHYLDKMPYKVLSVM